MKRYGWGILWRMQNKLEGRRQYLLWNNGMPLFFKTRREAAEYVKRNYGYIRSRKDLRTEPHGWLMPIPVKVVLTMETA